MFFALTGKGISTLVAQTVKRLPTMWETRFQSLGGKDPLEKEMTTHSSILAWKIPWMEEPGGLQSMGWQRVGHDFTFTFTFTRLFQSRSVNRSVMSDSRDPMDCSLPGSSAHGILRERILEWVVISFSRGSFPPRD